jgi:hypothetical protein
MTRVIRFFQLGTWERSILIGSFVWVTLFRLGLWILPFSMTKRWTIPSADQVTSKFDKQTVIEIVRAVRFASKFVPYASCLTQALAARKLLEQHGQSAELKIGVAKGNEGFEAHAWIEIDGRIVLGKQRMHSRYAVLGPNQTVLRY